MCRFNDERRAVKTWKSAPTPLAECLLSLMEFLLTQVSLPSPLTKLRKPVEGKLGVVCRVLPVLQMCSLSQEFVLTVETVTIRVPEITPRVYGLPGLYEFLKCRARFVGRCVRSLGRLVDSFARRLRNSYKPYKPCTNRPTNRARHLGNSYKPYKRLRFGGLKSTPL